MFILFTFKMLSVFCLFCKAVGAHKWCTHTHIHIYIWFDLIVTSPWMTEDSTSFRCAWHLTSLYTLSVSGVWWWGHTKRDICDCRWACKSRLYCHHQPGRPRIHLFILLDCYHQSEHYKSSPSSIGNLLMHAADQCLTSTADMQSNSSLSLSRTHSLSRIYTNKHIRTLCANTHPI